MVWLARSILPLKDWAPFVDDFGWDVRSSFVFDIHGARFLVALVVPNVVPRCYCSGTTAKSFLLWPLFFLLLVPQYVRAFQKHCLKS